MKKLLFAFVLSLMFLGSLEVTQAQDPTPICLPCPPQPGA